MKKYQFTNVTTIKVILEKNGKKLPALSCYKQGRKRPLDTPEKDKEKKERETVMTEIQRNMIEKERKRDREREREDYSFNSP